jgi:hypothetical protein
MHLERRFLNWGIFFIVLGGIPLAVQQGWLDRDLAARAWQLWPLLIIAAGVGLLLRRTSLEFLGGLVVAATLGAMLGGMIAVGADFAGIGRVCGGDAGRPFTTQQGTLAGAARVELDMNCGDLTVATAPGSAWSLSGTSDNATPPDITQTVDRLVIESPDRGSFFFGGAARDAWTLSLPADPILTFSAQLNAGEGRFGLTGAKLDRAGFDANAASLRLDLTGSTVNFVRVNVNAGSARLVLPSASLTGRLEVNAGSIAFCVPEGVGVRISVNENITGANNFGARGLVKSGSTWQSANFGTAPYLIDLVASANAAAINLNPEEGCQ